MTGIYKIENLVNGKIYIGQAVDIDKRWNAHINDLKNNRHYNEHLQRACNKYGIENFKFEVLEECLENELNEKEIYWIDYFGSNKSDNLYNYTAGGEGIKDPCMETRNKMRLAKLGHHLSEEHIQKLIAVNKSRCVSAETRQKISLSRKGKKLSDETKYKIGQKSKGRKKSQLWFDTIREVNKGNKYALGYKHTEEEIEKIRQAGLGRKFTEETRQKISNALKGKPKSKKHTENIGKIAKGRIWINNGEVSKMIYPNQLEDYQQQGYILGRIKWKE